MIEAKDILNPNSVFYDFRIVKKQLCDAIVAKNEIEFNRIIELLRLIKTKQEENKVKTDIFDKIFNNLSLVLEVNVLPPQTTLSLAKTGRELSSRIISEEKTPLYHAIENNNEKAINELLTFEEIDVNKGYAAVQWQFSMQSELDPSSSMLAIEKSPLYLALEKKSFDIVLRLLQQKSINIFKGLSHGLEIRCPIELAIRIKNPDIPDIIIKLLEAGASLSPTTFQTQLAETLNELKPSNIIFLNCLFEDVKIDNLFTNLKQIFENFYPEVQRQYRLPENLQTINISRLLNACNFLLSQEGLKYLPKYEEQRKKHCIMLTCLQTILKYNQKTELTLKNICLRFFNSIGKDKVELRKKALANLSEELRELIRNTEALEAVAEELKNPQNTSSKCSLM